MKDTNKKLTLSSILKERESNFNTEFCRSLNLISFTSEVFYHFNFSEVKVKLVITNNIFYVILTDKTVSSSNPKLSKSFENIYNPLVSLNFNLVTVNLLYDIKNQYFKLYVLGYEYPFFFTSKLSNEIFDTLIKTLEMSIVTSEGYRKNLLCVSLIPNFYKNYFITQNEFAKKAKTGDVLIFRGYKCSAKCQRIFTGSNYDHVALLLKRGSVLWVYEATSLDGCMARRWSEFLAYNWNFLYEKMTYRELIVKKGNKNEVLKNIEKKMEDFVKATERKKYKLTACGFCCLLNSQKYEKSNDWKKASGFFCSQLVCASYCNAGILNYNSDTRAYMPNYFSKDGKLPFKIGYELGPEYIIDFNSEEKNI